VTRPAKITWAAAVLLFASGIASALGIFALSVPGADRTVSIIVIAIGVWGIAMGAGLFRLWRWARISALIAGGFSAYVGFTLTPMLFFIQVPVPPELSEQVTTEVATELAMTIKIAVVVAFLLFAAIGFWWAYLFSSRPIKELHVLCCRLVLCNQRNLRNSVILARGTTWPPNQNGVWIADDWLERICRDCVIFRCSTVFGLWFTAWERTSPQAHNLLPIV
jgi:hypothetical protein